MKIHQKSPSQEFIKIVSKSPQIYNQDRHQLYHQPCHQTYHQITTQIISSSITIKQYKIVVIFPFAQQYNNTTLGRI
jgi:hypothetical protein